MPLKVQIAPKSSRSPVLVHWGMREPLLEEHIALCFFHGCFTLQWKLIMFMAIIGREAALALSTLVTLRSPFHFTLQDPQMLKESLALISTLKTLEGLFLWRITP